MAKGKYYEVVSGVHEGRVAAVDNNQDPGVLKLKKFRAYLFDKDYNAHLDNGRHVNCLISQDRLKQIGFYD